VKDESCQIGRSYTPITYGKNHFDLLVKKYMNGSVSNMIHDMKVGEYLCARGPIRTFDYSTNMVNHLGMVCKFCNSSCEALIFVLYVF
jgi:NAD(P)H-flavin reductase